MICDTCHLETARPHVAPWDCLSALKRRLSQVDPAYNPTDRPADNGAYQPVPAYHILHEAAPAPSPDEAAATESARLWAQG